MSGSETDLIVTFPFRNIEEDESDNEEISNGDDQSKVEDVSAEKVKFVNITEFLGARILLFSYS